MTTIPSAHALFEHAVDYAGTFAPAALPVDEATANFLREQQSEDAWLLGRLVVVAASLDAVEAALPFEPVNRPYELSVVVSANRDEAAAQLERVAKFNRRWSGRARIASVEFAPAAASDIALLAGRAGSLETFFEAPLDDGLDERLDSIAAQGAAAKVRTGGTVAPVIPPTSALARFLHACAERRLPFKATAGLHHAIRSCYSLTYERDSETAVMHGFVNFGVAAALAHGGAAVADIDQALAETDAAAFAFGSDALVYRGAPLALEHLAQTRRQLFRSFGSCAFREPVDELARLCAV